MVDFVLCSVYYGQFMVYYGQLMVDFGLLWLTMFDHVWLWLNMVDLGWLWFNFVDHGWTLLAMVDYGWPCWICLPIVYYGNDALSCSSWLTYVKLLHSSMVMSKYDIHQGLFHIAKLLKRYVGFWCSPMTTWHYDVYLHCIMLNCFIP